jgi:hypothetical protein
MPGVYGAGVTGGRGTAGERARARAGDAQGHVQEGPCNATRVRVHSAGAGSDGRRCVRAVRCSVQTRPRGSPPQLCCALARTCVVGRTSRRRGASCHRDSLWAAPAKVLDWLAAHTARGNVACIWRAARRGSAPLARAAIARDPRSMAIDGVYLWIDGVGAGRFARGVYFSRNTVRQQSTPSS